MRHNAYLERSRHGILYFRIRVPESIRQRLSLASIRRSLRNRCRREAAQKAGLVLGQIGRLFDKAVQGMALYRGGVNTSLICPLFIGSDCPVFISLHSLPAPVLRVYVP